MIETDFYELLTDRAAVYAFSTVSAWGTPSWSTSVGSTYLAYVEWHTHKVVAADGQEAVARGTVYLGPTSSGGLPPFMDVKDQLRLNYRTYPSSSGSTVGYAPRVLSVDRWADDSSSRYAVAVHFA